MCSRSTARRRSATHSVQPAVTSLQAGITATTSSASSASPSSRWPTARSSPSGWNDIGGYRLWLRDQGRERVLLRASLGVLAVRGQRQPSQGRNGARVHGQHRRRVDDAVPPPLRDPPGRLLYLGYDGAVNPTSYLTAWQHLQDIDFAQVAGWAPPISATSSAPKPGAILLSQTDISTADGLDPSSLRRALKQPGKSDGG